MRPIVDRQTPMRTLPSLAVSNNIKVLNNAVLCYCRVFITDCSINLESQHIVDYSTCMNVCLHVDNKCSNFTSWCGSFHSISSPALKRNQLKFHVHKLWSSAWIVTILVTHWMLYRIRPGAQHPAWKIV